MNNTDSALSSAGMAMAITGNPYVAGLFIASSVFSYVGDKQRAKEQERALKEEAEHVRRTAELEAEEVLLSREFSEAEEKLKAGSSGLASGAQSFQRGTGIQTIIETNNAQATKLAEDILGVGTKRVSDLKGRAKEAGKAHEKSLVGQFAKHTPGGKLFEKGTDIIGDLF